VLAYKLSEASIPLLRVRSGLGLLLRETEKASGEVKTSVPLQMPAAEREREY
jgi:hypothetical protein